MSTTNSALDLNVVAVNREAATQAFINISDPKNGLFDKADLISVNCTSKTDTPSLSTTAASSAMASKYPCTALIKVVLTNDSSFYFLNTITSGVKK